MRCEEIMKKDVECVKQQDTVQSAAMKMRDSNVGFLPVCDNNMKVMGTITDRDITIRVCAENKMPGSTKIGDVMTREAISCRPEDDVHKAEELRGKHQKSRMMVVDKQGKLVGVISLSDIATHEDDESRAVKTMREVTEREVQPH